MAENSTKINIDGDAKSYIAETEKARKSTVHIADAAAQVGTHIEGWAAKLSRAVLGITAVARAVAAASEASMKTMTDAGKASEKIGSDAVRNGLVGSRLGVSPALLQDITRGSAVDPNEMASFVSGLPEMKTGKHGKANGDQAVRALRLYSTSLVSKEEISAAMSGERGAKSMDELEADLPKRWNDLGAVGQGELRTRGRVNATKQATAEAQAEPVMRRSLRDFFTIGMLFSPETAVTGNDARVGAEGMALADAQGRTGAQVRAVAGSVPIVGSAVGAAIAEERLAGSAGISEQLEKQTRLMEPRPTVGPGADFQ
jgi:hypothetical protein